MTRKESLIRNMFKSRSPSPSPRSSPSRSTVPPSSPTYRSFSESMMEENIDAAESFIARWDNGDEVSTSNNLFTGDRQEAKQYLRAVKSLQSAMHYFISRKGSAEKLVRAQNLMEKAMKGLQKEFYRILSSNRQYLDAESVSNHSSRASTISSLSDFEDDIEDELRATSESISEVERVSAAAMGDLKLIADSMISSGYAKECLNVYKLIRKSIVDEGIYHLGVERSSNFKVQKADWEVLELKIKGWLHAVRVAVRTLFYGERILCDHVFSSSETIRESCFTEIAGEAAAMLFSFPEEVAKAKKSPEKMFRTLDMYEAILELWPEIEMVFSYDSCSAVKSQAVNSLVKLGEAVRATMADFESAITKDVSRTAVPGGGVHPLTRYVMNYLAFLADYNDSLSDVFADFPVTYHSKLPESYFGSFEADEASSPPITVRFAWLVLVLLCKLDGKAELCGDVALSYLFLANNLQYVLNKVRDSNLRFLLGDDWFARHEAKVRQYAAKYERVGWSRVFASLPADPTAEISPAQRRECFRRFNISFDDAYKKQTGWVVPDQRLRDEIKVSLARRLVPAYRAFYEKHRDNLVKACGSESLVIYAPENLDNYLSDLFFGTCSASSASSSPSRSSHARCGRRGGSR